MGAKFVPLTLELIDEGQFKQQVQEDLAHLQEKMVNYAKLHGEQAQKAKGKLVIEVSITCDSPRDQAFTVKAITKTTIPNSPASVSLAVAAITDTDQPALFVREAGSDASPPQQGKLVTRDGRAINQDTGKPIPNDPNMACPLCEGVEGHQCAKCGGKGYIPRSAAA